MNDCLSDMFDIVPSLPKKVENNIDKTQILENKIKLLETKLEKIDEMADDHHRKIRNIESKIQDFNILELFKNSNGEDGENSNMIVLINNLDKKFSSKINLIDEKMKKIEEINYKTNKDVQNIVNSSDLNKRNFNHMKESQESLENKINNIEKKLNLKYNEITNRFSEKLNSIEKISEEKKYIDNKIIPNLQTNASDSLSSKKEEKNNDPKISLENREQIKEIVNHITEMDKYLKSFPQQIGIDQIKLDINSLKSSIGNCSTLIDLKDTREREEELQKQITFLKEQFDDYNADQTDHEDLQNVKRKVETLTNKSYELETNFQELLTKKNLNLEKNRQNFDINKYLEKKFFEEFKTQIIKEFTNVNDNFNHLRKLIDNILDSLKNKASFKDIKALEDDILAKLEDLKLTNTKKYAERVETIKNIKYLDQQIKQIIQYYIKKNDKDSNNWLIAKKPLNGNLCASCESYLGELKDNTNYIPWNKYPNRDIEKLYRLGNGFSKMLQMIQIDENDKKNVATSMQNSEGNEGSNIPKDDNLGKTVENVKKGLPKIKMNQTRSYFHTISNINNINPEEDNINLKKALNKEADEQNNQPKITKIYRMSKENS